MVELKIETLSLNDATGSLSQHSVRPSETTVCDEILALWREDPLIENLSVDELLRKLLEVHSEWDLKHSEVSQILDHNNLTNDSSGSNSYKSPIVIPDTPVEFDSDKFEKIKVHQCKDGHCGRGVFASKDIKKDELIFEEKLPLCVIPPLDKLQLMVLGKACGLCGKLLNELSQHFIFTNGLDCNNCTMMWCSKQCKKQDAIHNILKHRHLKSKNSAVNATEWHNFENYCKENLFNAAYSVGIILAASSAPEIKHNDLLRQFTSLATISKKIDSNAQNDLANISEKAESSSGILATVDQQPKWKTSYELFRKAFQSEQFEDIDFEKYLSYIGIFNINQVSGQVFYLNSFINHACEPNVRIEIDTNKSLKVFARKEITKGSELSTTYINPLHGVKFRRMELRVNYGFICKCERCLKDLDKPEYTRKTEKPKSVSSPTTHLSVNISKTKSNVRRKSSMRNARPDLTEMLKNGQEFDLDIPEVIGRKERRSTSVRFDNNVILAVEK